MLAAVALGSAGCQLFTGPLDRVEFTAERSDLDPATAPIPQIELRIVNHESEPIQVPVCGERILVAVESLGEGEWTELTPAICQGELFRYVTVDTDELVSGSLLLNLRGTFRFLVDIRDAGSDSESKQLTSQVVEIQE